MSPIVTSSHFRYFFEKVTKLQLLKKQLVTTVTSYCPPLIMDRHFFSGFKIQTLLLFDRTISFHETFLIIILVAVWYIKK